MYTVLFRMSFSQSVCLCVWMMVIVSYYVWFINMLLIARLFPAFCLVWMMGRDDGMLLLSLVDFDRVRSVCLLLYTHVLNLQVIDLVVWRGKSLFLWIKTTKFANILQGFFKYLCFRLGTILNIWNFICCLSFVYIVLVVLFIPACFVLVLLVLNLITKA